jgi:F-type H+-transporting ATPase subunit b
MQQLLSQLGIDWHLLLAQAVNFFLLLVVLRLYVYKPLLKMMHDRRMRIEEGLMKADEADRRLHEVDETNKGRIKAAEAQALGILKKTEGEAKELEARMLADAKTKEADALANTQALLRAKEEESRRATEKEAAALVRRVIAKTVELSPEKIDDALIAKAVEQAKQAA